MGEALSRPPPLAPAYPVEVDWSHPLSRGLTSLYVPAVSGGYIRNLAGAGGDLTSTTGSPVIGIGAYGPEGRGSDGNGWYGNSTPAMRAFTTQASVYCFFGNWISGQHYPQEPVLFGLNYGGGDPYQAISFTSSSTSGKFGNIQLCWNYNGTGTFSTLDSTVNTQSVGSYWNALGTVQTGGNAIIYVNGAQNVSASAGSGTIAIASTSQVAFASDIGAPAYSLGAAIVAAGTWNRALSAQEAAWLNAEPFAMLRPVTRRTWGTVISVAPPAARTIIGIVT
jgi:hypothetical protein